MDMDVLFCTFDTSSVLVVVKSGGDRVSGDGSRCEYTGSF